MKKIHLTILMKITSLSLKTVSFLFTIVFLVSLNLATLFSANFFNLLSSGLSHITPTEWMKNSPSHQKKKLIQANKKLNANRQAKKKTTQRIIKKITARTARNITVNVSSVLTEAIPIAGITVVLGVTAMDIYDACETSKDMNELLISMEAEPINSNTICGMTVPTKEEILKSLQEKASFL